MKLEYDATLSIFAFNFNLRQYNSGGLAERLRCERWVGGGDAACAKLAPSTHTLAVGTRRGEVHLFHLGRAVEVDPMMPMLKPPGTRHSKLNVLNGF